MSHGLVKRLQLLERRLVAFFRGLAQVLEQPLVAGLPRLGLGVAKALAEVFA
jgi:hypothetical protein